MLTKDFRERLSYRLYDDAEDRLRALTIYIADKCKDDPAFGVTKLNKILFFVDFKAYALRGKPITGAEYEKLPMGPAPKGMALLRGQMERDGEIKVKNKNYFNQRQQRVVPLRDPNLSLFTGEELAFVDGIVKDLQDWNASQVSDLSHGRAWRAARKNDLIPYQAAFLMDGDYTEDDIARTEELNRQYCWE